MKILRITESQYKRLVSSKELHSDNIIFKREEDREKLTNDIIDFLDGLGDYLEGRGFDLYIDKIEDGLVYIDADKYKDEEIKKDIVGYIKWYVDFWGVGVSDQANDFIYGSGEEDIENTENCSCEDIKTGEEKRYHCSDPEPIECQELENIPLLDNPPEKTIKTLDINDPTLIKPSSYYGSDRDYGWRDPIPSLCIKGKFRYCKKHWHGGEDYPYPVGTEIYVLQPGVVEEKGIYTLKIKHDDGSKSRYVHCDKFFVSKGDRIESGTLIGTVGKKGNVTGPHLHFEYWKPNDNNTSNPKTIEDKYIRFKKK